MSVDVNVEKLVEEVLDTQQPALVLRDGQAIAAIIPFAEYKRFTQWQGQSPIETRQAQQRRQLARERLAFERMKPELLREHSRKHVAFLNGELVDEDADKQALAKRVYARFGYRTMLITQVQPNARVIHFDSPERARQ